MHCAVMSSVYQTCGIKSQNKTEQHALFDCTKKYKEAASIATSNVQCTKTCNVKTQIIIIIIIIIKNLFYYSIYFYYYL